MRHGDYVPIGCWAICGPAGWQGLSRNSVYMYVLYVRIVCSPIYIDSMYSMCYNIYNCDMNREGRYMDMGRMPELQRLLDEVDMAVDRPPYPYPPYRGVDIRDGDVRFDCDVDSGSVTFTRDVPGVRNDGAESDIREIYITDIGSCAARFIDGVYEPDCLHGVCALPDAPTAIVSIGGWRRESERPRFEVGRNGVVSVWQRDVDDACNRSGRRKRELLTAEDAESFAQFIGELGGAGAERLVVHCGSGISRSSAAAAAASKTLWGDDLWAFARPNVWGPNVDVYTKLLHGLGLLDDLKDPDCVPRTRHRFAEWCFRGDNWMLESYNADAVDLRYYGKTMDDIRSYDKTFHTFDPRNNPLGGTRDWELLKALKSR